MSIKQVQVANILEEVAKSYFASGVNPQLSDILRHVSQYFAKHPAGSPLPVGEEFIGSNMRSNVKELNRSLAHIVANIDVLYEAATLQLEDVVMLNTVLRTHLDRLKTKRRILETKIDSYLLGIYNSEGYFYSIADSFADLSLTDVSFTNCFVDTASGTLSIPAISSLSDIIRIDRLGAPNISVIDNFGSTLPVVNKAELSNALDGLTNTAWFFEVHTASPREITATVSIPIGVQLQEPTISKIEFQPYGVVPVECSIQAIDLNSTGGQAYSAFSNSIQRSTEKMVFVSDDASRRVEAVKFTLVKREHDYMTTDAAGSRYVYIFGAKEIAFSEQVFDASATFVSQPLGISEDVAGTDAVIDAVSVVIDDTVPANSSVKYYVAMNNDDAEALSDFDWREIVPVGNESKIGPNVIHFQNTITRSVNIKSGTTNANELILIPLDTTNTDTAKRNPSNVALPGVQVYRVAAFADEFLANSIRLEEGVNTTRMYHVKLDTNAITRGLAYWKDVVNGVTTVSSTYGNINTGNDFFYGGDIGQSGRSVYIETYLETTEDTPVELRELRKVDVNSKTWDVKVYLNGREVGYLPSGVDSIVIPWKFQAGRNHISLIVNIPKATTAVPSPYIGGIDLMRDTQLQSFGTVKLGTLNYVDPFKMKHNQTDEANTFTIVNGEIVTRKKLANTYKLHYSKSLINGNSTGANNPTHSTIRFRADLSRASSNSYVTPLIYSYRLRFSYR